jgi:phosphoribosylformimino-5-aminoimidazole carboxamide ribotide isomerase
MPPTLSHGERVPAKRAGEGVRHSLLGPHCPLPSHPPSGKAGGHLPPVGEGLSCAADRMILFPAIDLKDGKCVRLKQGEMDEATVYSDNPARQARKFREMGFSWLHVVDLDGAVAGETRNEAAIEAILWNVANTVKIQLGGGIRERKAIDDWLEEGVTRVILGTVALRDPDLVREAARDHPGGIAVGIDARGGKVAVEGWAETSDMEVLELAKMFEDAGVAAIIYTDIDRDGVLAGVNWEATIALADAVSIPVIASGGLASMADIERLKQPDAAKLEGAIIGRALYDGRIDPKAALKMLAGTAA